jgi:Protein of unknown function (DUF2786)
MQQVEIQSVINKIRKLASKDVNNGASEGEAMNAANKIGELLKMYNLNLSDVFLNETDCVKVTIDSGVRNSNYMNSIVTAIGPFCDCKVWKSKARGGNIEYHFFGLPNDTEMCKYLYEIIDNAIEAGVREFKMSDTYRNAYQHRKTLTVSFMAGMGSRIRERLCEITRERKSTESIKVHSMLNGCTDIVLMKKNKVESEYEKLGLNLRFSRSGSRVSNGGAYNVGKGFGDKVNFNRPISNRGQLLLS